MGNPIPPSKGLNSIVEAEHIGPNETGDNINAKRVVPYSWNTATSQWSRTGIAKTARYDYSDSTTIYTGEAEIGTSEGAVGWTITKYDLTDTANASGKIATDVNWTSRASGTYA